MPCNLEIAEAIDLRMKKEICRQFVGRFVFRQLVLYGYYVLQFIKKPFVDTGKFIYPVDWHLLFESFRNRKDSHVSWFRKLFFNVIEREFTVSGEAMHSLSDHSQSFL